MALSMSNVAAIEPWLAVECVRKVEAPKPAIVLNINSGYLLLGLQ
jgi:hypothetical protein